MRNFADLIRVRNLETGAIGRIARRLFDNPKINPGILVEVDGKAKPYLPEMYKSRFPVEESVEDSEVTTETPSEEEVTDA